MVLPAIEFFANKFAPYFAQVQVLPESLTTRNIYFLPGHTFQLLVTNED
jgi:hypothetical protein